MVLRLGSAGTPPVLVPGTASLTLKVTLAEASSMVRGFVTGEPAVTPLSSAFSLAPVYRLPDMKFLSVGKSGSNVNLISVPVIVAVATFCPLSE